jgi:hypothetical protein
MRVSKTLAASLASQQAKGAKGSKYGNVKVTIDGVEFSSKKEAARFGALRLMERAGEIQQLELQPKFPLKVNGKLVCSYVGDFAYRWVTPLGEHDALVVEDVKSPITRKNRAYRIKVKLLAALTGIVVKEV